jgi:hypothetical protein
MSSSSSKEVARRLSQAHELDAKVNRQAVGSRSAAPISIPEAAAAETLADKKKEIASLSALAEAKLKAQAEQAAYYLLRSDLKSVDSLVKANRNILSCVVEKTDHRNRRVKGDLLDIAKIMGAKKANENDRDLIQEWSSYFSAAEIKRKHQAIQLSEHEKNLRMVPFVLAIKKFFNHVADASDPETLEVELAPYIEEFENALKPDPNFVITSGHIFDPQIFVFAIQFFMRNAGKLGGVSSDRGIFFDIHCFGKLQAYASAWDLQIIDRGILDVLNNNKAPDRSGIPASLEKLGSTVVLDIFGNNGEDIALRQAEEFYQTLCKQKDSHLENRAGSKCLMM